MKQSGKYNLFYTDGTATLKITAKNTQVTSVSTDACDFFVESIYDGTVTLRCDDVVNHSKKVTLWVSVAGYVKPVKKEITLSTVTTAPKLKLSATSSVINTNFDDKFTTFQVLNGTEVLNLAEDDISYSVNFADCKVADNAITLTLKEGKGGTATFNIQQSNWTKSVKLTHKVTVQTAKPTMKLSATTLKVTNPTTAKIGLITLNSKTTAAFRNAFGDGSKMVFNQNTSKFTMTLSNPGLLTPGKSYTVYLDVTPEGNAENVKPIQVKLTVKVKS